jgi:hypothetical protein
VNAFFNILIFGIKKITSGIYCCSSILSTFPFHLRFTFVPIVVPFAFHFGSHTKSIAPVTFKPMERKSERKWNDNWNENETQIEWEC